MEASERLVIYDKNSGTILSPVMSRESSSSSQIPITMHNSADSIPLGAVNYLTGPMEAIKTEQLSLK